MTVLGSRRSTSDLSICTGWVPRRPGTLLAQQLAAIAAFHEDRKAVERAISASGQSREQKLDAHRRLDVVRRQHEALIAASQSSLETAGSVRQSAPRVLLVHRNEWLRHRVAADLTGRGVEVVAQLDNGAEAVGLLVAEQPDVLFVEDTLPMVAGLQLLTATRRYAPGTAGAIQVAYDDGLTGAFEAGAAAVFTRRIPPADIAGELARLVAA